MAYLTNLTSYHLPDISAVSAETTQAYYDHRFQILDYVNRKILELNKTEPLMAQDYLDLMYANHQSQLRFIYVVLRYNLADLLQPMMAWAYRAFRNQGFSLDYLPIELDVWQAAFREFLTTEQADQLDPIYNWMRAQHPHLVELANQEPEPLPTLNSEAEAFLWPALEGDFRTSQQIVNQYQRAGHNHLDVFNTIFIPTMYQIGRMWERGQVSAVKEHMASSIVTRLLANMQVSAPTLPDWRRRVIVTAGQNEYHQIGAWMIADSLEDDGWQVQYLGANAPEKDLLELINETRPHIVAISVNMISDLPSTERIIKRIKAERNGTVRVMVGGQAFAARSDLWQIIGADGSAPDIEGAIELARTWWNELQHQH
jgi:methanogenic corrinoid protein MtbC1